MYFTKLAPPILPASKLSEPLGLVAVLPRRVPYLERDHLFFPLSFFRFYNTMPKAGGNPCPSPFWRALRKKTRGKFPQI